MPYGGTPVASVTFNHVYKRFPGGTNAVNDLHVEIADKEFLVFVGPSGCGKSTSLRMLAGLEEISEGEILIGDRVVNNVAPKDRDVAMVFQSYALYPHMTVYDNMAFGLRLRKTPKQIIDQRLGTTFIYVTHDQVEAMTMGTRIAVLNDGELLQLDTPFNLYNNPRNLFVAGFIGSPSMNFLDANLRREDGQTVMETKGFSFQLPPALNAE